jgi:AAA+ ATPase superfamily predicted ATPase
VRGCPELPSILQRFVDQPGKKAVHLALAGSSQRMMHGLAMDASAPLYGRAREMLKLEPLRAGWLSEALGLKGRSAVEAYAVWGGSPRNWELAADYDRRGPAVDDLVLDRNGVLHGEPLRLLMDDMRSAVQPHSILSLVGAGCHRMSEIAGRLGKPAASLSRPLALLTDLGYLRRETPFGEPTRSTRRSVYRLADPFLAFWYRFVVPHESLLEIDRIDVVRERIAGSYDDHVGTVWEDLARSSAPFLKADRIDWGPAQRWWGVLGDGRPAEIDVVAESVDRKHVLLGEASWADAPPAGELVARLRELADVLPFVRGRAVHVALWLKTRPRRTIDAIVFGPDEVLSSLRR